MKKFGWLVALALFLMMADAAQATHRRNGNGNVNVNINNGVPFAPVQQFGFFAPTNGIFVGAAGLHAAPTPNVNVNINNRQRLFVPRRFANPNVNVNINNH